MTEEQIRKAKTLLDQRENFEKALKGKMVRDISTNHPWGAGAEIHPEKMAMVEVIKNCKHVCEAMLRIEAKQVLKDIDRQLKELGVSDDLCMGPAPECVAFDFDGIEITPAVMIDGRPYKNRKGDRFFIRMGSVAREGDQSIIILDGYTRERPVVYLFEDGTKNGYLVDDKRCEAWPMPEGWAR